MNGEEKIRHPSCADEWGGSRFRLTPFYDVISIYPLSASGQISMHKVRMAMAVSGKNRHYRWMDIRNTHWPSSAGKCRFSKKEMAGILEKCGDLARGCIEKVQADIPAGFPEDVAAAIFSGILTARDKLISG